MSVGLVLVAAGRGTRLGRTTPKAFVEVSGHTVLAHALTGALAVPVVDVVVLVVPPDRVGSLMAVHDGDPRVTVVAGGAERTDSVAAGLAGLDAGCDVVLVHDAARCLTPVAVFDRVIAAVRQGAAGAVPALAPVDTVKTVDRDGVITGTPDRSRLRAVQTPQGFERSVLDAAYRSGLVATDDAALVEAAGHHVRTVDGDPRAFKITTALDLAVAEVLLARD